jgi:hypothetical protein
MQNTYQTNYMLLGHELVADLRLEIGTYVSFYRIERRPENLLQILQDRKRAARSLSRIAVQDLNIECRTCMKARLV